MYTLCEGEELGSPLIGTRVEMRLWTPEVYGKFCGYMECW